MPRGYVGTLDERFWRKVAKRGKDECWPWTGKKRDGRLRPERNYGRMWVRGHLIQASRVAWEVTHGEPPPRELDVLHRCDNGQCVNPSHLWLGTHADNMADMKSKGRSRSVRGEANHFAKLTQVRVDVLKELYALGATLTQLTIVSGMSFAQVRKVTNGKAWREQR